MVLERNKQTKRLPIYFTHKKCKIMVLDTGETGDMNTYSERLFSGVAIHLFFISDLGPIGCSF